MKLHENTQLFDQAIRATAQQLKLREIYIEKDYWVTFALFTIFHNEIGAETVFKGGTALSKCYGLIERFSEDIDLVVLRREGESNNKLTTKIKTISKVVSAVMPEIEVAGITHKMGMNRKTGHGYPKIFKGDFGQIRDMVIVEATWLGCFEPYTTNTINSFVYDMMLATGQKAIAEEYGLLPFEIRVLDTRRTICEKIMSLVRFSYGEKPIEDLKQKVRHTYDLHQLLKQKNFLTFFESEELDKMLLKVAQDDVASYANNNKWLVNHPKDALIFADLENSWNSVKGTYSTDFNRLMYGELPPEETIYNTLKKIKDRLQKVTWTIQIN